MPSLGASANEDGNADVKHSSDISTVISTYEELYPLGYFDDDIEEVLKRYDHAFRSLYFFGILPAISTPFTSKDDPKLQKSIVDFSMAFAIEGEGYIDEIQTTLQVDIISIIHTKTILVIFSCYLLRLTYALQYYYSMWCSKLL